MPVSEKDVEKEIIRMLTYYAKKATDNLMFRKKDMHILWAHLDEVYAAMMMDEFFCRFNVDASGYHHALYFPAHGEVNLCARLIRHQHGQGSRAKPLTFGLLIGSVRKGYWTDRLWRPVSPVTFPD